MAKKKKNGGWIKLYRQLQQNPIWQSSEPFSRRDAWVDLFNRIFSLNNEYIARVNHVEPGMPAKKYFNALCDSFNADAKALLEEIGELAGK